MSKPTGRFAVGVARELGRSVTTAALAVGATSIVLDDATGFSATSKVTIYDGANTEVVTASALAGSTLTVGATANAHGAGVLVTTVGTVSAGPTATWVLNKFDPVDNQNYADDDGWRGAMVDAYDTIATERAGAIDLGGDVFPDTIGYALGSVLGDVVFTGGTPNQHAFAVKNSGDAQPPTLQLTFFNGNNTRQWGGVQLSEVNLKAAGVGKVTHDCKAMAYASGVVSAFSPSPSTIKPLAGFTGITTIAGSAVSKLMTVDLSIKRQVDALDTIDGSPDPLRLPAGIVTVDGKATYVMDDDTYLNYYLNNTQPAVSIAWNNHTTADATQAGLTLTMTKCAHKTAKMVGGKSYVSVDADLHALANTTDVGASAGYSQVKATLRNAVATGTFG